ncbi:nitroreductase family protein [Candidatus Parcubacteria bacterium]|nr:nitroreductase family protein [Candidatus Parcubacteria bacterium]
MDTIDCIKTRRSRRLFLDREVSEEKINQILECAITAPSSIDCQPWHFIVVRENILKRDIANLRDEDNQQQFLTAPVLIVVCVDTEKSPSRYIDDGVTTTQNILLAAHDLGLGSVYMCGSKPSDPKIAGEIRNILNIPKAVIPITILPIGYPNPSEKPDDKNLLNLNHIVHNDKW